LTTPREGKVVHVVTERLEDLSDLLRSVGQRHAAAEALADQSVAADDRKALARKARDIYIRDLRPGPGIRVPTRDFR
jgi:error-prone DNA polymerase